MPILYDHFIFINYKLLTFQKHLEVFTLRSLLLLRSNEFLGWKSASWTLPSGRSKQEMTGITWEALAKRVAKLLLSFKSTLFHIFNEGSSSGGFQSLIAHLQSSITRILHDVLAHHISLQAVILGFEKLWYWTTKDSLKLANIHLFLATIVLK